MRITTKGQVTIPQAIRESQGMLPHTEIRFVEDGNTVRIEKVEHPELSRGERLIQHMRGRGKYGMSTDELMALLRGED